MVESKREERRKGGFGKRSFPLPKEKKKEGGCPFMKGGGKGKVH